MAGRPKGIKKSGGRKKGVPNKTTQALKEMILQAAELAGGEGGTVAYLERQARENSTSFNVLLGKVIPTQVTGDPDHPLHVKGDTDAKFGAVVGALESLARAKQGGTGGTG